MWTVPEVLHWTVRTKLRDRLNYFVLVNVACNTYWRKIVKTSKQGYIMTLNICSSVQVTFRCICAWSEIGLKVCIVYEVWFEYILIFITLFILETTALIFFLNFWKKDGGLDFFHKKEGVDKIERMLWKRGYHLF